MAPGSLFVSMAVGRLADYNGVAMTPALIPTAKGAWRVLFTHPTDLDLPKC